MSITFTTPHRGGPGLNMASGNAADLLELLGLRGQWVGEAPAEDILGRCLIAQALLGVATDDGHGRGDVTDGRIVSCGRPPGYLADRLAELREIATWAHHHHLPVVWD